MEDAVIVSAVRTPVGSFGGQFKDVAATELGAHATRAALEHQATSTVNGWHGLIHLRWLILVTIASAFVLAALGAITPLGSPVR